MFDNHTPDSIFAAVSPPADVAASPAEPARVPLERLEAQICELAGHLAAATCRFLVLLGDFDARRGWAQLGDGFLRAVAVVEVPAVVRHGAGACPGGAGAAGPAGDPGPVRRRAKLSYAKVRALTRIATPATEAGLAELAGPMTANQLERFARAHRQVTQADDAGARVRRRLAWRFEEDGSLSGTFRLPPLQGAVLLKALRAACADLAGDPRGDVSAETSVRGSLSSTTGGLLRYLRRGPWPGWSLLRLAPVRVAGRVVRGWGLAAGMVNFRAEAMVSRGAGSGARHPGLLALRSASGLGMPADAGRPAPTAFNRAGEKLRAAGEELPRVSGGVGPRRLGGLALPLLREEGHWAPVAGAGGMEALVRPPALGGGGCAGRRRRRRSQRPSWCRGRSWSRSSAARRQHTPPGPWRGAHGPRPRSR